MRERFHLSRRESVLQHDEKRLLLKSSLIGTKHAYSELRKTQNGALKTFIHLQRRIAMFEGRIENSVENIFWNSNYSRIMNFHDSLRDSSTRRVPQDSRQALHPDVYFHLTFVPFVNRNAVS
jgi:hypothetical protein